MNRESDSSTILQFGRFEVLPRRRELRVDGHTVELGARAFDLLMALVEARGTVLSKDELMAQVWPGRIVEENNLQVQIAALRKALAGERELVRTVAGRGYQFTGTGRTGTPADRVRSRRPPLSPISPRQYRTSSAVMPSCARFSILQASGGS